MKTRMKLLATTVVAVLGATVAMTVPTLAHGTSGQGYPSHGYGMMNQGHGMMNQGHGMMNQGHGMMGRGNHHGQQGMQGMGHRGTKGDCSTGAKSRDRDLSVDDVRKIVEGRLARRGNDRLKVGKVEAKDDNTIVAEIVTVDDSLVKRIEFDRKTGRRTRVK